MQYELSLVHNETLVRWHDVKTRGVLHKTAKLTVCKLAGILE
jgi:hypothetical protein